MDFTRATDELTHYKGLAAETLRKDAPHPDGCPALKIHGVMWAIPARGQRVAPQIDDAGKVTDITEDTADTWAEIEALQSAIKLPDDVVCPKCGQATETSFKATKDVLMAAFALAARALRAEYDLTPSQLTDLLAFEGSEVPEWFHPLLRWSSGLPMEAPDVSSMPDSQAWEAMLGAMPRPPSPVKSKRWWKFWRARSG